MGVMFFSNVFIGIPIVKMRVAKDGSGMLPVTCSCHRILAAMYPVIELAM